jgi:HAD superfamily hydrolase (TIGR01509 family)
VLVIFDCDGVLVDSEPLANASFARALAREGIDWSVEETMCRLMGRSLKSCVEIIEGVLKRKLPDTFLDDMQAETYQAFRDAPLRAVPGVAAAALALQAAGVKTCVASSGAPDKMRLTLGLTGLWPLFEGRVFSAVEVPRGKPFPDLFLHAASRMGAATADSIVIEDSVPGIEAARTAGMRALAYAGAPYAHRASLAAAGAEIFDDMSLLPMLVMQ